MFKKILNKKLLKNQKGLTLIELLAVIVILAIIAAIAIPAIGNVISNSKDKAILSDAAGVLAGAKIAIADGACGDSTLETVTCKTDVLKDVFDGELTDGDKVEYTKTGKKYTITFDDLKNIKNKSKFEVGAFKPGASTSISEKDLNKAMGNTDKDKKKD
ncbi:MULTISPECIES: prepilin-type N-terminal cleavage/methylation domain-containing protein [unclassified Lysinibacillus]|uniref:prepilin-type N-terminal cleavage/methylation domain-containing protein n=1 Tax=unclassified Lysinibacillus TaxID=2636778 RepID=UPI00380E7D56